jgi:RHS repeat-associated protein
LDSSSDYRTRQTTATIGVVGQHGDRQRTHRNPVRRSEFLGSDPIQHKPQRDEQSDAPYRNTLIGGAGSLASRDSPVLAGRSQAISATYTYDAAGKQLAATGTSAAANPFRYAQGLLDEQTDWLKHGIRWHDTTASNWTALDPIGLLFQPDASSRYSYVAGNPINRLDPSGQDCDEDLIEYGIAGVVCRRGR